MKKLPSAEYWQERAERTLLQNEKSVLQYQKDLKRAYAQTMSRIKKETDAFYHRYAKENQIDLATARQRLNPQELEDFKTQAKIYLDEINRLGLDPKYKEYLKQLSSKAYISKLEEIQANIRHQIELLQKNVHSTLEDTLKRGYENAYYNTLFDVQKNAGFGINFTALGDKQLTNAVNAKWLGANYSDRIWTNKSNLINQLNQIIPQEFVRGRGSRQVATDISDRLNVNYNSALRLARTEMNHLSSQATLKAYKDSGIIAEYEYLSTLDGRTSEICRELDGKVFKLSEAKAGINLPPMHPNCRSTTIPYFPEDDISEPTQRIARDADGAVYLVRGDITYKEWIATIKDDSIQTPSMIRVLGIAKAKEPVNVLSRLSEEYGLIPKEHLEILESNINKIEILPKESKKTSGYDRKNKIVYLKEDFVPGELIHEFGHTLETVLELYSKPEFLKVLNHRLVDIKPSSIIRDTENFEIPIDRITSEKFVSEYQGMLYPKDLGGKGPFVNGKFNSKVLGEYFSEGYREFLQNPKNLKEKDPELYKYINSLKA